MESHPKVMTVSYGTFSCSLEGFDDPFTTMQLVAEYFRKLASQDRYFGGEPLQPDHNALHQIAREANPYKVDAEVTDTGITLRKATVVDSTAPAKSVEQRVETPVTETPEETADSAPAPLFSSKRAAPTPAETDVAGEIAIETSGQNELDTTLDDEIASFVEAAVFTSRRGVLDASPDEPEQPASELIRAADQDSSADSNPGTEDTAEEIETIKSRIASEIEETEAVETLDTALLEEGSPNDDASEEPKTKAQQLPSDDIQREEEALERLLETTNSKLDTPAHARRSNALERLKAAVAATEAERRLRASPPRTERPTVQDLKVDASEFKSKIGEVRRDHEEIVKMSRPKLKTGVKRSRGTIAALILGNDQRVSSSDAAEAAAPVKKPEADSASMPEGHSAQIPRSRHRPALKIVRPEDAASLESMETEGFEAFAQKIGANTLHELLEASAAYLAIVEDEPRFSQDRIVENLSVYLTENNVSVDATNRSMNRLMRDGRILRVKHDSYTISKSARHGFQDKLAG